MAERVHGALCRLGVRHSEPGDAGYGSGSASGTAQVPPHKGHEAAGDSMGEARANRPREAPARRGGPTPRLAAGFPGGRHVASAPPSLRIRYPPGVGWHCRPIDMATDAGKSRSRFRPLNGKECADDLGSMGIADPEQLAALGKLLDEYAKATGISGDQEARDRLAERIWALFNEGVTGHQATLGFQSELSSGRRPGLGWLGL